MKGQVVVGAIMLVLIFIAVVGSLYFFVRDTEEKITKAGTEEIKKGGRETEASLAVYGIHGSGGQWNVTVKNIGGVKMNVSDFAFFLNSSLEPPISAGCQGQLPPQESCNFTFSKSLESGTLKVTGTYGSWDEVNLTKI